MAHGMSLLFPKTKALKLFQKVSHLRSFCFESEWELRKIVKFCKNPVKIRLPGAQKKSSNILPLHKKKSRKATVVIPTQIHASNKSIESIRQTSQNLVGHASNTHHHTVLPIQYPIFHQSATWITLKETGDSLTFTTFLG